MSAIQQPRFRHCLPVRCAVLLLALSGAFPPCGSAAFAQAESQPSLPSAAASSTERLAIRSDFMGFDVPVMVYLPAGYGDGCATCSVWYGLHGYSSSETFWPDTAGIGAVADRLISSGAIPPTIMVFPLTRYDSAKVIQEDMADGKRDASQMERFLCTELIPYIDAHCQAGTLRDSRSIGGFSMGGMFALQIGLHHPELFGSILALSPALTLSDFSGNRFEKWLSDQTDASLPSPLSDYATIHGMDRLRIYLDYGMDNDPFSTGVQTLFEALRARGIEASVHPHAGGHTLQLDLLDTYLRFVFSAPSESR